MHTIFIKLDEIMERGGGGCCNDICQSSFLYQNELIYLIIMYVLFARFFGHLVGFINYSLKYNVWNQPIAAKCIYFMFTH